MSSKSSKPLSLSLTPSHAPFPFSSPFCLEMSVDEPGKIYGGVMQCSTAGVPDPARWAHCWCHFQQFNGCRIIIPLSSPSQTVPCRGPVISVSSAHQSRSHQGFQLPASSPGAVVFTWPFGLVRLRRVQSGHNCLSKCETRVHDFQPVGTASIYLLILTLLVRTRSCSSAVRAHIEKEL